MYRSEYSGWLAGFVAEIGHVLALRDAGDNNLGWAVFGESGSHGFDLGKVPLFIFIRGICQDAGLGHIWGQDIGITDKILHVIAHFLCVGRIWFAVVAHNRIDDDQIVRPLKITDKVGYDGNLSGGSEETGADTGEFKAKLLPFVDAGLHMISVILVVKAFKTGVI